MTNQTVVQSAPSQPSLGELSEMGSAELNRHVGNTNTLYAAAYAAYEQAAQILGDMLTEQIVRRVLAEVPDAVTVRVAPVESTFETHQFGQSVEGLTVAAVLDGSGAVAGVLSPFSPVYYMLERLSPLMDMATADLDLPARAWSGVLATS